MECVQYYSTVLHTYILGPTAQIQPFKPVSYTHLDVYKRQVLHLIVALSA